MEEIMETEVETTEAGANEQEVAETASIGPDETGENEPETAEPAAEGQSVEDNARFAAARRRAEAQFNQRIELERQAARDEMIRQMYDGQLDPYTNRPISSEADLRAYQQAYQREQEQLTRNQMQQAGLDPDILDRMIENNPKVKRAEQLTAQFEAAEGERKMNEAIKEISHLDPNAPVFNEYVNRGYSLVDAFRLANFDTLTGKKAAAAKQQAMNNVNGKSHLTTTAGNAGGDDVVIDPQEMQMMKHAFPNLTHAQLVAKFKKYK